MLLWRLDNDDPVVLALVQITRAMFPTPGPLPYDAGRR